MTQVEDYDFQSSRLTTEDGRVAFVDSYISLRPYISHALTTSTSVEHACVGTACSLVLQFN